MMFLINRTVGQHVQIGAIALVSIEAIERDWVQLLIQTPGKLPDDRGKQSEPVQIELISVSCTVDQKIRIADAALVMVLGVYGRYVRLAVEGPKRILELRGDSSESEGRDTVVSREAATVLTSPLHVGRVLEPLRKGRGSSFFQPIEP